MTGDKYKVQEGTTEVEEQNQLVVTSNPIECCTNCDKALSVSQDECIAFKFDYDADKTANSNDDEIHNSQFHRKKLWAKFNIYIAACSANLSIMAAGCVVGWSSPTAPKITVAGQRIHVTKDDAAWLVSLLAVGASCGPFVASAVVDYCGRKWTIIASMFVLLLSWSLLGYFEHLSVLYSARLVAGVGVGCLFTAVPMYINEISPVHLKGSLGSLFQLFICFGSLLSYGVGPFVSYQELIFISASIPLVCILLFVWMPDSPYHSLNAGNKQGALQSLQWLRGYPDRIQLENEIADMMEAVKGQKRQKSSISMLFTDRAYLKALYYSCALVFFQQMTGINIVAFYAQTIFDATGSSLSSSLSTILIGVVMTASSAVNGPAAKIFGIRRLLCFSAIGVAFSLTVLGTFFYMKDQKMDTSWLSWLPVTSLICFMITFCSGFGPFVWVIMADIFPLNLKAIASAVTASFCWILTFLVTKFFGIFTKHFGQPTAYWMFAAFSIVAFLFVVFQLPDTDGKSYDEIQRIIAGRRNLDKSSNVKE